MTTLFLVPLRQGRRLMHILDNLAPTHAGIIGTERDLSILRPVWDDAHLSPAEIVGPQVLKPHPFHAEDSPFILLRASLHPVVPITVGSLRVGFEEAHDLRDRESLGGAGCQTAEFRLYKLQS